MFSSKYMIKKAMIAAFSLTAFAGVVAQTAPHALAAGGNGAGYNGPSLNSQAIPVELDRGIRMKGLLAAFKTCVVDGDSKAGLVSLGERLITAISKQPYSSYEATGASLGLDRASEISVRKDVNTVDFQTSRRRKVAYMSHFFTMEMGSSGFQLALEGEDFGGTASLYLPKGLPAVVFESIVDESRYDDLGRPTSEMQILQGIRITFPENYGSAVPLVNVITKRRTRLTVNMEEYVQCLQSQIQKNAE